jgi:hypothetical protein
MGILDNLEAYINFDDNTESAWDKEFSFESKPMPNTDNLGQDKFWEFPTEG